MHTSRENGAAEKNGRPMARVTKGDGRRVRARSRPLEALATGDALEVSLANVKDVLKGRQEKRGVTV
jgi:hypothetical protein